MFLIVLREKKGGHSDRTQSKSSRDLYCPKRWLQTILQEERERDGSGNQSFSEYTCELSLWLTRHDSNSPRREPPLTRSAGRPANILHTKNTNILIYMRTFFFFCLYSKRLYSSTYTHGAERKKTRADDGSVCSARNHVNKNIFFFL